MTRLRNVFAYAVSLLCAQNVAQMPLRVLDALPRNNTLPFHFPGSTIVPTDNWLCNPQQAIMQDQGYYNDPSTFKGFWLVRQEKDDGTGAHAGKTQFSTPSSDFPFR